MLLQAQKRFLQMTQEDNRRIAAIIRENATLKREKTALRDALSNRRMQPRAELARIIDTAAEDAGFILDMLCNGQDVTRDVAREYGISQRQYGYALTMLKVAGLYTEGYGYSRPVGEGAAADAIEWLDAAIDRCENDHTVYWEALQPYQRKVLALRYT